MKKILLAFVIIFSALALTACKPEKPVVEEKEYVVTFDVDGGTPEVPKATIKEGESIATSPVVTKEGFTFLGWFSGTTKITFPYTPTQDITLKAHWEELEYTFTLNPGVDTIVLGATWTDSKAVFKLGDQTQEISGTHEIDNTKIGVYTVTYKHQVGGSEVVIVRQVAVIDVTAPVIELNEGIDTIRVGQNWTDAGVNITDDSGEILSAEVVGEVNNMVAGTYEIKYIATDSSGNSSEIIRIVNVIN